LSTLAVTAQLFAMYRLRFPMHPHGHLGAVGAAVAVARLRGDDPAPAADVAASLPLLAVWTTCFEGATVRNTYSGMAAAIGLLANRLAGSGFRGARDAQAAAFEELVGERVGDPGVIDPERLAIMDDYAKVYSACALSHTTVAAALELGSLRVDDIERIEVETTTNNCKIDRAAVARSLSTRFSLSYAAAAAIVHGHARPEAFEPDDRVFALASRVVVRASRDFDAAWPEASPATVTVHLRSSGAVTARVDNPPGYPARSLGPETLRSKFEALTQPSDAAGRRFDYDRLLAIEAIPDMAELFHDGA
jgi:2-methylcitrate dehydratase PrpD